MTVTSLDKEALRRESLARRAAIPEKAREQAATAVAEGALSFLELPGPAVISGYYPFGDELDCLPLLRRLIDDGHSIGLPVTRKGQPLIFRAWTPETQMVRGALGIPTPPEEAPELTPVVLLVPLAAFDERGYRIGYGGGFYDRTLAKLRAAGPVTAVGVAFAEQRVDRVPNEPHDQPLDWMLMPEGAYRVGRA
ncbi:5-formyltetrahydrofolate cyclo-ligase [Dichotomicrobium thermohalophilum]|uniref:5-formyltetrahydrofolate cyclo-ligase n=1 Tax=Dichotomicrobium thermohalophilum TaxID=933063 RepID=A0A397Q2U1_9HYPH|nr:5-formyltetrahydrofolate cyclo-ligase [Dichotomicrobium thermohalophilum]RIA55452.1 5-formyltetrahydrofolate cyclo-ligase [Dichotomicrobium thermohalophilum]